MLNEDENLYFIESNCNPGARGRDAQEE